MLAGLSYSFLMPPTVFIPAVLLGALLLPFRRRLGLAILLVSALCLYALSTPALSIGLLRTLEARIPLGPGAEDGAQAIVVLAGDVRHGDGRDRPDDVGLLSLERLQHAAALYRARHLPIIVTGGPIGGTRKSMAELMQAVLERDFATPVRWLEPHSRTTFENAVDVAAILGPEKIGTVLLVTQPWHMPRALWAFEHAGLHAVAAPTAQSRAVPRIGIEDVVPEPSAVQRSFYALHELMGLLYYRLRYGA
jgi:uncharacterized SAM-binding protein YcdF (DUF218 family)